jgi:hypothetical protein
MSAARWKEDVVSSMNTDGVRATSRVDTMQFNTGEHDTYRNPVAMTVRSHSSKTWPQITYPIRSATPRLKMHDFL